MGFAHILVFSIQWGEVGTLLSPTGRALESLKSMGRTQKTSNHKFELTWFEIRRGFRISSLSASCPILRTVTKGRSLVGTADASTYRTASV
jgi:hypothetical protein